MACKNIRTRCLLTPNVYDAARMHYAGHLAVCTTRFVSLVIFGKRKDTTTELNIFLCN